MQLQPLTLAELPRLLELDGQLFFDPWSERAFRTALAGGRHCALGAWLEGQLVGYLIGSWVADEAELLQIGVDARYQRRGVAAALLGQFRQHLRGLGVANLYLEVRESAAAARAFYQRVGFVEQGRRRSYYPTAEGREDALLYSLKG